MTDNTVPICRASVRYGDENIRVVVVRDTHGPLSAYVAQGLDRDIASQGSTVKEALRRLAVTATIDSKTHKELGIEIPAAPSFVHEWYAQAEEVATPKEGT